MPRLQLYFGLNIWVSFYWIDRTQRVYGICRLLVNGTGGELVLDVPYTIGDRIWDFADMTRRIHNIQKIVFM